MPRFPTFPELSDDVRRFRLQQPRKKVAVVIDSDTDNEIDDQFAIAYALLSPREMEVEAVYAAPFHNARSESYAAGMRQSYKEAGKIVRYFGQKATGFVFRGATDYVGHDFTPRRSAAVRDLIARADGRKEALYVLALGAITNIASALLVEPALVEKIVVIWLGGNAVGHTSHREFNMVQDWGASRTVLDSGVPLVLVPAVGVSSHLLTTIPELDAKVKPCGALGHYLATHVAEECARTGQLSRPIWDLAAPGWITQQRGVSSHVQPSPVLSTDFHYHVDYGRHPVRVLTMMWRDPIFGDFFAKLRKRFPTAVTS